LSIPFPERNHPIMHLPLTLTSSFTTSTDGDATQTFARYRPLRHLGTNGCLGEGGYGKVFACWDTHLRRVVVLKIARQYPSLLWVEYCTLLRLRGTPAVPVVYDLFEDQGHTCLVMEYLPGVTLDHWLEQALPGNSERCLAIGVQLCQLLALLASHELVHNDIKPVNLLLCGQRLVLLDFGLAHRLGQAASDGGTPGYAPPERLSHHIASAKTDLYSAGCVLAQVCDACSPTLGTHVESDPRWACLEAVIEAMLHPDPCSRIDWSCAQQALRFLRSSPHPKALRSWPLLWRWWRSRCMLRHLRQEIADILLSLLEVDHANDEPLAQANQQGSSPRRERTLQMFYARFVDKHRAVQPERRCDDES
jgi:serine/threonine protein kinase